MAFSQKHVRIRLRFSSDCHEPSWLFVNKLATKTISDLAEAIRVKFPNTNPLCFKLTLANFLLPPWESTELLQNGDVVRVQFEDDPEFSREQHKSAHVSDHSPTRSSCRDHMSQASDQSMTESKREKKRKKKRQKEDSAERPGKDEAVFVEVQDGVSSHKKHKKAHKAKEQDEQSQDKSHKQNDLLENTSDNEMLHMEKCADRKRNASIDLQCEIGETVPVKRKKSHSDVEMQGHKLPAEELKQPHDDRNGNMDKTSPSSEKDSQKKHKRRRRKRKKILESSVVDVNVNIPAAHQVTPLVSGKRRKNQQALNTHKHFGDSEEGDQSEDNQCDSTRGDNSEDQMVRNGHDESMRGAGCGSYMPAEGVYFSNEETDSNLCQASSLWDGSRKNVSVAETALANGTSVFIRKRKWKFPELTKEQQLATTATNKSVIIQNPVKEQVKVFNGCTDVIPVVKSYEDFPLLSGPPRSGDKIAYKILELTSDYCPEVSAYKEGTVMNYDPSSETVSVKLHLNEEESTVRETEVFPRKFDVHIEDEDVHLTNVEEVTNEVLLKWNLLLEPRLLV